MSRVSRRTRRARRTGLPKTGRRPPKTGGSGQPRHRNPINAAKRRARAPGLALALGSAFASLREVVRFYATRSTNPERWYPSGVAFEDTPAAYRGMINTTSVPYNRRRGDAPALTDDEVDAIVAFLGTLTDRAR